jgi:hypothetical protein
MRTSEASVCSVCTEAWVCGMNGTQLTGIARPALEAKRPVVNAVILPSGESVDLR